jgi:uncharacterized protein (TIGR02271 family)
MPENFTIERFQQLRGSEVYDANGERIGNVEELFLDRETRRPEWLGIGTGFLRSKRVLVPVVGAQQEGSGVRVPYDAELVKQSPDVNDDEIQEDAERSLYAHYGVPASESASPSTYAEGGPSRTSESSSSDQQTVTRSEEELRVGTERREAGRVRLHKFVDTEPVETDVTLERERATVERRPIERTANEGVEIGEQDLEVTLERERPVVTKETVAKEEVSVGTQAVQETEHISDTVKREVVEIEGDVAEPTQR